MAERSILAKGFRNVSYLTIGNVFASVINFIGFIYIARELGPGNYGIFVTLDSFVAFFQILTLNNIAKVMIREGAKNPEKMGKLFEKTIGLKKVLALFSILICLIVTMFMPYPWLTKLLIGIFAFNLINYAFNNYFMSSFQAKEKFQYMSALTILSRFIYVIFGIAALLLGFGLIGFILFVLAANFISLYIRYRVSKKEIPFRFKVGPYYDKKIIKASLIFSLIVFLGFFASSRIDILMLSFLRSEADTGIYGLAVRLTDPFYNVKNLIILGLFPTIVKIFHSKKVKSSKLWITSLIIGVIMFSGGILGYFITPYAIPFFWPDYADSVPIFQVLIFVICLSFMEIPFTNILAATNNEKSLLKITWITPVMNIPLNLLFLSWFGMIGIAYSTVVVHIVRFFIFFLTSQKVLKKQGRIF